jgi:hypothetical protein
MADTLVIVLEMPSGVFGASSDRLNKAIISFDQLQKAIPKVSSLRGKYSTMSFDGSCRTGENSLANKIYEFLQDSGSLSEAFETWGMQRNGEMPSTIIEIHAGVAC